MVIYMNKKVFLAVLVSCLMVFTAFLFIKYKMASQIASQTPINQGNPVIIIDAGHGGVDGGAVGRNGVEEKEINLKIALKLNELLQCTGYNTVMIRTEDICLADDDAKSIKAKKTSDLHNRMAIMEKYEDAIFVSIHQNSYYGSKAAGTQVFYSPNSKESETLADLIQSSVKNGLQPDNKRLTKKADSSIYLLYSAKKTAVMVECGFLSDYDENLKLCNSEYQEQLAFYIAEGIKTFLNE
jgi:N-acetylmuramoyl-L-alanine amidase